jgi:hypothetical protein
MLWNQNIREPISLADGGRVATLADVRSLLCEMSDGLTPGEKVRPACLPDTRAPLTLEVWSQERLQVGYRSQWLSGVAWPRANVLRCASADDN